MLEKSFGLNFPHAADALKPEDDRQSSFKKVKLYRQFCSFL
jgi:hypothetical protein